MTMLKLASVFILLFSMVYQSVARAEAFRARIVKIEGQVYIINSQGEQRKPEKKQYLVNSNETVITRKDSKAVIQYDDGVMSVLDEKSSIRVEQSGWLSQLGGKVYYVFRKVFGTDRPKKIKTKFATIGIRGTTFIVDMNSENQQVALKEGRLNIESTDEHYEIIKKEAAAEGFEKYKQQAAESQKAIVDDFSEYKKNVNKEFVEYKKSFDLEANKVISVKGNRVRETELDKDWESSFESFSDFSKDYIGAYRELDQIIENE